MLRQEVQGLRKQAALDAELEKLTLVFIKKVEDGRFEKEDIARFREAHRMLFREKQSLISDPKNRLP